MSDTCEECGKPYQHDDPTVTCDCGKVCWRHHHRDCEECKEAAKRVAAVKRKRVDHRFVAGEKAAEALIVAWLDRRLTALRVAAKQAVGPGNYRDLIRLGDEVSGIKHAIEKGEHRDANR